MVIRHVLGCFGVPYRRVLKKSLQPLTLFSFNISACGFVLVGLKKNNNNNPICKAPVCQKTSVALVLLVRKSGKLKQVAKIEQNAEFCASCSVLYPVMCALTIDTFIGFVVDR